MDGLARRGSCGAKRATISCVETRSVLRSTAGGSEVSDAAVRITVIPMPMKVRELVQSLLGKVSEEDRILLMLKEVEGLSLKELEKIYRVNENALKVRLFRARQRVLKAFEAEAEGFEE